MDRQATVLLADDMAVSLVGKINLTGIYTSDIFIPLEAVTVAQLVFLFSLETDLNDQFQHIKLQITLPGEPPKEMNVPILPAAYVPGRTRLLMRHPFLIQQVVLRPGPIEARVIHDKGQIEITSLPWISLMPAPESSPVQSAQSPAD